MIAVCILRKIFSIYFSFTLLPSTYLVELNCDCVEHLIMYGPAMESAITAISGSTLLGGYGALKWFWSYHKILKSARENDDTIFSKILLNLLFLSCVFQNNVWHVLFLFFLYISILKLIIFYEICDNDSNFKPQWSIEQDKNSSLGSLGNKSSKTNTTHSAKTLSTILIRCKILLNFDLFKHFNLYFVICPFLLIKSDVDSVQVTPCAHNSTVSFGFKDVVDTEVVSNQRRTNRTKIVNLTQNRTPLPDFFFP